MVPSLIFSITSAIISSGTRNLRPRRLSDYLSFYAKFFYGEAEGGVGADQHLGIAF
jgi:hypothetical protein